MQGGVSRYSWYALGLLVMVYVVNFVDRQILSILADEIKLDLGISDADLGFLYGTAFAVFYAVFGIPLARLADIWVRKNVIALGLAVWSAMTALSGTAGNLLQLGAYRIGVGVGESSATPAAYSMLSDYFPEKLRATVFSIYIGGVYVGQGLGLFLGGFIVDQWNVGFDGGVGWFGLKGWQAAFFAVGLPGLALAAWVATLREPRRGQQDGIQGPATSVHPWRELGRELATVLPPFTLFSLLGGGVRARGLALHAAGTLAIAALAWGLIAWLGEAKQWLALGVGLYAAFAWSQGLALRDPPTFALLFRSRAMRFALLSVSMASFVTYVFMFWTAPYLLRAFAVKATTVGQYMLIANILGGLTGAISGGMISDRWKRKTANGRMYTVLLSAALCAPVGLALLNAGSLGSALAMAILFNFVSTLWNGSATAIVTELVMPRMRAIASALMLLMYTFVGLALGPFAVGQLSDAFVAAGETGAEALRHAMSLGLIPIALALFFGALALRHIPGDEASRLERARQAGESLD
ncbi:MAG: MFS transporter [Proteobacteria bacterium]|nr:MFS transporter [Pseudomonadota bacterium]